VANSLGRRHSFSSIKSSPSVAPHTHCTYSVYGQFLRFCAKRLSSFTIFKSSHMFCYLLPPLLSVSLNFCTYEICLAHSSDPPISSLFQTFFLYSSKVPLCISPHYKTLSQSFFYFCVNKTALLGPGPRVFVDIREALSLVYRPLRTSHLLPF